MQELDGQHVRGPQSSRQSNASTQTQARQCDASTQTQECANERYLCDFCCSLIFKPLGTLNYRRWQRIRTIDQIKSSAETLSCPFCRALYADLMITRPDARASTRCSFRIETNGMQDMLRMLTIIFLDSSKNVLETLEWNSYEERLEDVSSENNVHSSTTVVDVAGYWLMAFAERRFCCATYGKLH